MHPRRTWPHRSLATALALAVFAFWTLAGRAVVEPNGFDFTGDGRSDFVTISLAGGGLWSISDAGTAAISFKLWGDTGDRPVPADFDGDGITDPAVWRPGPAGSAGFWILPSTTGSGYFEPFGQTDDNPRIVGDYDGDGKADIAVFRRGVTAGDPAFWFYKRSSDGMLVAARWGEYLDVPVPGDYDGDGKYDLVIARAVTSSSRAFFLNQSTAGIAVTYFGGPGDGMVPGDYDGDGKTDIAVIEDLYRLLNPVGHPVGPFKWWIMRSVDGAVIAQTWGLNLSDLPAPADYDGDGKTDIAVHRYSSDPWNWFVVSKSTGGLMVRRLLGFQPGFPLAQFVGVY